MRGVDSLDTTTVHYELHSSDGSGRRKVPQGRELPTMTRSEAWPNGIWPGVLHWTRAYVCCCEVHRRTGDMGSCSNGHRNECFHPNQPLPSFFFCSAISVICGLISISSTCLSFAQAYPRLLALLVRTATPSVIMLSRLRSLQMREGSTNVLEVIHAHRSVTSIASQAF